MSMQIIEKLFIGLGDRNKPNVGHENRNYEYQLSSDRVLIKYQQAAKKTATLMSELPTFQKKKEDFSVSANKHSHLLV